MPLTRRIRRMLGIRSKAERAEEMGWREAEAEEAGEPLSEHHVAEEAQHSGYRYWRN